MQEYTLVHEKRKRGRRGNKQSEPAKGHGGGFFSEGTFNDDQRAGNFSFDTIHGMPLVEMEYTVPSRSERMAKREEFNGQVDWETNTIQKEGVRARFLKMLAKEHKQELIDKLGLTETEIGNMTRGIGPVGYNVHHKLALHGGGKNEFKNFILTPIFPHDQWHKDVMDPQLLGIREGETRRVLIPYCEDMIYDPKKYGFTKENQPVKPNYKSNVHPSEYPQIHLPDQIDEANRAKEISAHYDGKSIYTEVAGTGFEPKKQDVPSSAVMQAIKNKRQR